MGIDATMQWSPVVGVCRYCLGGFERRQADLAAYCSGECERAHCARRAARRARVRAWLGQWFAA